jgi:hypothetical protein
MMSESNGDMTDAMVFESLELIEVPVTIGEDRYVMREASEEVATAYQIAMMRGMQVVDGKVRGNLGGLADAQSLLLSRCILRYGGDDKPHPVDRNVIRQWPSRIVKQLFERLTKISEIDEEADTSKLLLQKVLDSMEENDTDDKATVKAAFDHFLNTLESKLKNAPSGTLEGSV